MCVKLPILRNTAVTSITGAIYNLWDQVSQDLLMTIICSEGYVWFPKVCKKLVSPHAYFLQLSAWTWCFKSLFSMSLITLRYKGQENILEADIMKELPSWIKIIIPISTNSIILQKQIIYMFFFISWYTPYTLSSTR